MLNRSCMLIVEDGFDERTDLDLDYGAGLEGEYCVGDWRAA